MRPTIKHTGSTTCVEMRAALLRLLALLLVATGAAATELEYAVTGINDELRANVLAHLGSVQLGRQARLSERDYDRVVADAARRARESLRPFGYYHAEVSGRISRRSEEVVLVTLDVRPGPPLRVAAVDIEIAGAGRKLRKLSRWKSEWPLQPGSVLDQSAWENEKQAAIEIAVAEGYRSAAFTRHSLEIDLIENRATLLLTLDTGPRYVFGEIRYGEHMLKPGILENVPRFRQGDPANARLLNEFRLDLWKTGYFTSVDVMETERPDADPPRVDLEVELETLTRNSYQGSLGLGTDTGMRLQAQWSRRPMSRNGDRLDVGAGWQEADDEFSIHGNYRLPIRSRAREYWTVELFQRFENTDLEVKRQPEDENYIQIANGNINEFHLRTGRLKLRNRKSGDQQVFSTLFVQYLNSLREFDPIISLPTDPQSVMVLDDLLKNTDNAVSVGFDTDLVGVTGKGWETHGRRDRFWVFVGNKAIGSDEDFTQLYLGTRRSFLLADRLKFLVRAELGYTDAQVDKLEVEVGQPVVEVDLSVTRLPNFYRFKAGGSDSVRGYGYEELSDNDIGSNNIVTASAEVELRVLQRWSVATFVDIGNAFNDWDDMQLRKGAGVGLRWYSIAGPIRVDVARALDFEGKPWRLHITIGTPLL